MKWTACFAMLCVTALMSLALCLGADGVALSASLMALSGLGGYSLKAWQFKHKENRDIVAAELAKAGYKQKTIKSILTKIQRGG